MSIYEYLSNPYFIGGVCLGLTLYVIIYLGTFNIIYQVLDKLIKTGGS